MKKLAVFLTVLMLLAVVQTETFAYEKKKNLEGKFYKKAKIILSHKQMLNLTDQQTDQIYELKRGLKRDLIMKKAEIEVIAVDIMAMLKNETVNTKKINKLIDKKYDLKKNKAKATVEAYAKMKAVLTAEQMDVLKGFHKKSCSCYYGSGKKACGSSKMRYHGSNKVSLKAGCPYIAQEAASQ